MTRRARPPEPPPPPDRAFCPGCGALVAHEPDAEIGWSPIPHPAPCGRPCAFGGIGEDAVVLGAVHRGAEACDICDADADDPAALPPAQAPDWETA